MLPIPAPEPGGSIEALASFLNLPSRNEFVLLVAWLLAAFRFGSPYQLLAISGEQGSAKTVLSQLLKSLVDPNVAPVRAPAREERDLMIAANNGYLLAFDNLSGLPIWLSDALRRLASGGSFAVRRLYTTCTSAYCAIDNHVATRVRRFLVERHRVSSHGTRCFADANIFGELGVVRLRKLQGRRPSGSRDEASRRAVCAKSARPVRYDEQVLFQAARPIPLSGVEDVISRPDLADRAIFLTLPPMAGRKSTADYGGS
jgi:hypothetical protein